MSTGEETETDGDSRADRRVHESETVIQGLDVEVRGGSSGTVDSPTPEEVADLDEFSQALVEIGLIAPEELEAFAADSNEGVLGLSRALVKAGKLTPYQAAAIYQKKSRGLLIGNYVILDKLGQGGMGVVFKARHRLLGRVGALKILPPSFARDRDAVMRFRREVEAAGRLKHPNVVAAIDADEDRGVHFLVMDYVEGRDLDRVVRERGPMQFAQAIDCLIQAARGLEAAHTAGIIHRDIKPGNLMLDNTGTVRVLDLGLARIVDAANPFGKSTAGRLTQSGTYMGTVDYMAPEQAEDSHRVDHRADIYSLGCALYYLLTGKEPFVGDTILRRLMAHMERPAPSLRSARPDVPVALDEAYLKMMAKRPEDRPASMAEVISLLEACKSAAALAPKAQPELKVFNEAPLKRVGVPKTKSEPSIFARPTEREGSLLGHELSLEDLEMDVRPEAPPAPLTRAAKPASHQMQPLKRTSATRSRSRPTRQPLVIVSLVAAVVLGGAFVRFVLYRDGDRPRPSVVLAAASTPDHRVVAPTAPPAVTTTIFDGKTGQGWMFSDRQPVPLENIQPDGLNPHGPGSRLVVYNQMLSDFVLDFDYKLTRGCNSGVFLRVGDLDDFVNTGIEVALDDTTGKGLHDPGAFYDLVAPTENAQKLPGQWNHMTITAQGPNLAVALNGTAVSSMNLDQWTSPGKRPDGSAHKFTNITIASLARTGYLGFQDHGGDCWFKNIVLKRIAGGGGSTASSSVADRSTPEPAKRREPDGEPYVETARFVGHSHGFVEAVRLLPDGKTLLTASQDKTARLWELATGRQIRRLWHPEGVRAAVVLPDGRRAVTGCNDGIVRLWDLETGQQVRPLVKCSAGPALTLAISSDGRLALSGGSDKIIRLLDVENGGERREWEHPSGFVWSLAFSRDGQRVLSGGADGIVRLGELKSSEPLKALERHSDFVFGLAFAADGRHAVSSSVGQLILWDLDTGKAVRQVNLDRRHVATVAFRDDRHVVFATHFKNEDGYLRHEGVVGIWDVESPDSARIVNRGAAHLSVALTPDGGIVTGDANGLARIWRPSRSIAQARDLARAGKRGEAIAEYGKAIAARPNDAALLIERGRVLTEMARAADADADFSRAAQLAPDNLQKFLNDGWWLAGPYTRDLNAKTPIEDETAPDPSKPPPPVGNEPRQWRRVATGMLGQVDLRKTFDSDDVSALALGIVYSQSQKDVVILVGADDAARIWLNGRIELESPRDTGTDYYALPVTLRPGRNTILAKVANDKGPYGFNLRISEEPADFVRAFSRSRRFTQAIDAYRRAMSHQPNNGDVRFCLAGGTAFAEQGHWKEAAAAFRTARALEPGVDAIRYDLLRCYVALRDIASYQPLCREEIAKLGKNSNPTARNNAIWTAAMLPGALSNYAEVIEIARKLVDDKAAGATYFNTYGGLLYRAKQYQAAASFMKHSIDAKKGKGDAFDWVFMAMARHQLKQPGDTDALKQAASLANNANYNWQWRAEIRALLEEARMELGLPTLP